MGGSTTVEIILYYLTFFTPPILKKSTTVEIILYYLTSILSIQWLRSTTVEIILYYLTLSNVSPTFLIYNSRNYSILLNVFIFRVVFVDLQQ